MERLYAFAERGKVMFALPVYTKAQADSHLEAANAMLERCNHMARVCPQHSCQAVMINAIGAEKSTIFSVHQAATVADYAKTLARFLAFLEEVENCCNLHLLHSRPFFRLKKSWKLQSRKNSADPQNALSQSSCYTRQHITASDSRGHTPDNHSHY